MSLELESGEKIKCWDVIMTTTKGRQIGFIQHGLDPPHSNRIDEMIEAIYPCEWQDELDDTCEQCKKLGENTCGNDMDCRCFEPKN